MLWFADPKGIGKKVLKDAGVKFEYDGMFIYVSPRHENKAVAAFEKVGINAG